ncbi:hypothetical protein UPYG_G00231750 [Umbra pygmaea]|uniref:Tuberoinfundibular peptide of 39 residues n=1 Tax=Umbra pygmaea TaxID=75934 RepID=A0ABD0WZR1_UMBPY
MMAGLASYHTSRQTFLLLTLMSLALLTSGYPQPRFRPINRGFSSPGDPGESNTRDEWEVLYPSVSLRNWSMQMMAARDFGTPNSKENLLGELWLPMMSQSQMDKDIAKGWLG